MIACDWSSDVCSSDLSIPIVYFLFCFLSNLSFFSFISPYILFSSILTFLPLASLLPSCSWLLLYIVYHCGIYPFCPSTVFGSLWASFQDYLLACRLSSHHLYLECVGCTTLHFQTKLLVCFLSLSVLVLPIWIRIKLPHHLPLWHALSGSSPYLPLLGETTS